MRILSLTAGAAGMYCGTCMRDNALAAELIRQGHDVLLVPVYTPTLTDEDNVSHPRVFLGGISVYLQQHWSLFRHLPAAFDRLWDSPWLLRKVSSGSIPVNPKLLGELTVSTLRGEDGHLRKEVRKLTDWLKTEPAPDVVDLPYTLLIGLAKPIREALQRPVCCTLQGEDLFLEGLHEPWRSEAHALIRQNLQYVDAFIAVSDYYADFMSGYLAIPRSRIHTVPLGINLEGHGWADRPASETFRVGYFARVAPEKGLHVLAEAVKRVDNRAVLHAAGFLGGENKKYLAGIQRELGDRFRYHGSPDREGKVRFLQSVDVLSVPSVYKEPKGLFVLEALANGTPVVQPRAGAYPEMLGRTGGGLLFEPENAESLAHALSTLMSDPELRLRLAEDGFAGVREHHSISRMAHRTLEVYDRARHRDRKGAAGK
jgi:glycosyltransferase involved in cell wall biosynthesis